MKGISFPARRMKGFGKALAAGLLLCAVSLPAAADSVCFTTQSEGCTIETCLHADRLEFVVDDNGDLRIRLIGYRGKVIITYC